MKTSGPIVEAIDGELVSDSRPQCVSGAAS
jgi:hypothetical protein